MATASYSVNDMVSEPRVPSAELKGSTSSAVSWGAIFAGAAGAAALTMVLLLLGTGLGLAVTSPWSQSGVAASTLGVSTIIWVTLTQLLAAVMGGYLAGRLRTKWVAVHTDEVYFRDTAHGFLAWAIASLATATLLTSAAGDLVGAGAKVGATAASGVSAGVSRLTMPVAADASAVAARGKPGERNMDDRDTSAGYYIDALFRKPVSPSAAGSTGSGSAMGAGSSDNSNGAAAAETTRIFANALKTGSLPDPDAQYLGQLVAQRAGISQQDAQQRVTETFNRLQAAVNDAETAAKQAADKARKASAYTALWLVVSLLAGAFVASWSATLGGRLRDA
jgi:hypothetical protein